MWTILLDIDGTLIRTKGAGLRAISKVMSSHFGVSELPPLEVHGCTDFGIWTSIFQQLGLERPEDLGPLISEYCQLLEVTLSEFSGEVLPGVEAFLQRLSGQPDVAVGLLTGNAQAAAMIKMKHFGLLRFVEEFGGFGDFDADRNSVANRALMDVKRYLEHDFVPEKLWVIGDTVRDIECARSIEAKVLALETGGDDYSTLIAAGPDAILSDLADLDRAMELLSL